MPWEPAPGASLGGKYRLERPLAAGGMGSVWVARHVRLDANVAVKVLTGGVGLEPSAVARFEREAKACAQLQSPHVVTVHDFGVEDGTPYMVMELLRGEDLGDRIERVGQMSLAEAVAIAVPIGKALRVAHEAGIIHRDLKPRNIFIATHGDDEVVKLVDFGIARETKTRLVDDRTASGIVMGSPYHMSPEQAQALSVDHRTDLWALGVVLYRLVTGFRPFDGDNVTSVLMTICMTPHPVPSDIATGLSPEADAFFAKALAKDPARRFQSAKEMVDAFVAVADGRTMSVVAAPTSQPASLGVGQVAAHVASSPASSGSQPVAVVAHTPASSQPTAFAPPPSGSQAAGHPFVAAAVVGSAPGPQDPSASLALRAFSTGPHAPASQASASRTGLVIGVTGAVAAAAAGAFFLFGATRAPQPGSAAVDSSTPPATPSAATSSFATGERPAASTSAVVVAPVPDVVESGAPRPSAAMSTPSAPSATSAPANAPVRGAPRHPPPSAPPKAPGGPAIDPFTGLPVAR